MCSLYNRKWFEPRSYIPRWNLIVRVDEVLRKTVDSDCRFIILSGSHHHSRCTCHPSPSSLSFKLFFHLPITIQTRASLHSFEIPTVTLLLAGCLNVSHDQKCFSGLLSKGRSNIPSRYIDGKKGISVIWITLIQSASNDCGSAYN